MIKLVNTKHKGKKSSKQWEENDKLHIGSDTTSDSVLLLFFVLFLPKNSKTNRKPENSKTNLSGA